MDAASWQMVGGLGGTKPAGLGVARGARRSSPGTKAKQREMIMSSYGKDTKSGKMKVGRRNQSDDIKRKLEVAFSSKPAVGLLTVGIICLTGAFYAAYIYLGALVIVNLEDNDPQGQIKELVKQIHEQMLKAKEVLPCEKLSKCTTNPNENGCHQILQRKEELVSNVEGKMIEMKRLMKLEKTVWSIDVGISYALALATTIGYGTPRPSVPSSQVFTLFYSLLGIPLTMGYIAYISKLLLQLLEALCDYMQKKWFWLRIWCLTMSIRLLKKKNLRSKKEERRKVLMTLMHTSHSEVSLKFCLSLGMIWVVLSIPFILPIFKEYEDNEIERGALKEEDRRWNAFTMVYFSFISLSLVGLGDYLVPLTGIDPWVRLLIDLYLVVGLSITAMCIDRSSQVLTARLESLNKLSLSDPDMDMDKKTFVRYMLLGRRKIKKKNPNDTVELPAVDSILTKYPSEDSSDAPRKRRFSLNFKLLGEMPDMSGDDDDDDDDELDDTAASTAVVSTTLLDVLASPTESTTRLDSKSSQNVVRSETNVAAPQSKNDILSHNKTTLSRLRHWLTLKPKSQPAQQKSRTSIAGPANKSKLDISSPINRSRLNISSPTSPLNKSKTSIGRPLSPKGISSPMNKSKTSLLSPFSRSRQSISMPTNKDRQNTSTPAKKGRASISKPALQKSASDTSADGN